MSLRIFLLMSATAMSITACGAAPTGRSTIPIEDVTPIASGPTSSAGRAHYSAERFADPTLPDKQIDLPAESAFAAK